jgi:DNA repair photolyase
MQLNVIKNPVVEVPSIKNPIQPSKGFKKKELSDFKLDLSAKCGFSCRYCSSNHDYFMRVFQEKFADSIEQQLGERALTHEVPRLMLKWPNVIERLEEQLSHKSKNWGEAQTLMFSMRTDGFSPVSVKEGTTEEALRLVLENTSFRIRVLTKNAIVGTKYWLNFFGQNPDRFVVGLSIGTLDDKWAKRVEVGTSNPTARFRALHNLQKEEIPTYGMLCPIFPDSMRKNSLEKLIDNVNPEIVEHIWAEPYNDRQNWEHVREGYNPGTMGHKWLTRAYEMGDNKAWSNYTTEMYSRFKQKGKSEGWLHKLRYLLYESSITPEDAPKFRGFQGILVQCKPQENGKSKNPAIAKLQTKKEHQYLMF